MQIDNKTFEVSVILTLFNSRKFYKRALRSVLNQTMKDFELIIVDDGSNDFIEDELLDFVKKNSAIKYLRHSNRKHPLSLNSGITLSSGKYITFLDSDDEYKKDHLKLRTEFFKRNKIDVVHSPATLIGEEKDYYVPDKKNKSRLVHINSCIIGGTIFGKRKVFTELKGFKDRYSHDSEFIQRAKKKFKVLKLEIPSYIYHRDNPESVTEIIKKEYAG